MVTWLHGYMAAPRIGGYMPAPRIGGYMVKLRCGRRGALRQAQGRLRDEVRGTGDESEFRISSIRDNLL
jgi:hypothetical protein